MMWFEIAVAGILVNIVVKIIMTVRRGRIAKKKFNDAHKRAHLARQEAKREGNDHENLP